MISFHNNFNPFIPKSAKFKTQGKNWNFILQNCQKDTAPLESTADLKGTTTFIDSRFDSGSEKVNNISGLVMNSLFYIIKFGHISSDWSIRVHYNLIKHAPYATRMLYRI